MSEIEQQAEKILLFWFGRIEDTVLPSKNRNRIWFGGGDALDAEIKETFGDDLNKAILGEYDHWDENPRSTLALIVLLDQFSRNIHRGTPMSFTQDQKAMDVCVRGIERQYDHSISLIERSFFYMPFMHSESLDMQNTSMRAFKMLVDLSFPEARPVFENFYDYAGRHFKIIEKFGRYPSRNQILGRESTPEELSYMAEHGENPFGGQQ